MKAPNGTVMNDGGMKILLVEDNPGDARLIREALGEVKATPFTLEYADRLSTALPRLAEGNFAVVLLDLSLPDSTGFNSIAKIHQEIPDIPLVVLTGLEDDRLAVKAVQAGAEDYLVKGQIQGSTLVRALRYAMERHRLKRELISLSLIDDLTRLYNRRGFMELVGQQLKLLQTRRAEGGLVFYADMDGLKQINDKYGHEEGTRAIITIAEVLKHTFRSSDILARIGGDEFTVFAVEATDRTGEEFTDRLQKRLAEYSAQRQLPYPLSLSIGVVAVEAGLEASVEELVAAADRAMYRQKSKAKK